MNTAAAFRRHTPLPLDDGLYALQATTSMRSSLHRCFQRHGISRLPELNHPWTNGQAERMNRTLKEATVKRYHYGSHAALREHLSSFLLAYHHAKRLKTLRGLTPYEFVCAEGQESPERLVRDPTHEPWNRTPRGYL